MKCKKCGSGRFVMSFEITNTNYFNHVPLNTKNMTIEKNIDLGDYNDTKFTLEDNNIKNLRVFCAECDTEIKDKKMIKEILKNTNVILF